MAAACESSSLERSTCKDHLWTTDAISKVVSESTQRAVMRSSARAADACWDEDRLGAAETIVMVAACMSCSRERHTCRDQPCMAKDFSMTPSYSAHRELTRSSVMTHRSATAQASAAYSEDFRRSLSRSHSSDQARKTSPPSTTASSRAQRRTSRSAAGARAWCRPVLLFVRRRQATKAALAADGRCRPPAGPRPSSKRRLSEFARAY
mmetsp:Transcript_81086/g.262617  ORF Transcript_81086/g.262617 Transcript_81086/m.262617 type:complete len:208 (+) Transcript_81086:1235-1858(+)